MDENRKNFFRKHSSPLFKRKGVGSKKGRFNNSGHEQSFGSDDAADTVYRILCPSRKIGGVIGKGGGIIKTLREETQAKITVSDSVPGSDERVITLYSLSAGMSKGRNDENSAEGDMEIHCAAQDALLKVHNRIVEEDLFGGMTFDDETDTTSVTARLLVPNNMVGCVLGKRGDVIQRLRSETGATIRVLSPEHLPTCAMSTDELVQISGKPDVVKRALHEISTLLHRNPRKGEPPLNMPMPPRGQSFPPSAPMPNMLPPRNPMWSHHASDPYDMPPPMPWSGEYGNQPPRFTSGGFNGVSPRHAMEVSAEFSMKILCSVARIGGVIGKGGYNVKQLQKETGASIHVEEALTESEERVIRVSAVEVLADPRSQTIEAILQLQDKVSEFSEKGTMTTRLLVPSSKVGCILGQGGHVINEMRRRTQADIRVFSKDDKPECATEDEELVQVSGSFGVAKDVLAEISSRLRVRTLRDENAGGKADSIGTPQGFASGGSLRARRLPLSGSVGAGSSYEYEDFKGGQPEYEPLDYLGPRTAAVGYHTVSSNLETRISSNMVGPGVGGSKIANFGEVLGGSMKLQDMQYGGPQSARESRGSNPHFHSFTRSGGQSMTSQQSAYQSTVAHHGSYQSIRDQPGIYPPQSPYSQQEASSFIGAPLGDYGYQNIRAQEGSFRY
ncbi:KH domain-containing protein HEN4-like isoform X2 [Rhodamnia argentea]|uniref:KH domain-containing protein HEN4-like isoform X2 n=1 Tax=Rhodamnia argentea TaxID=178133 RepID=A0A8B8P2P9_9MYRT|nr:KH domain-containing protein HEN4-like isoform X2 [Rhodamnia argentea]